MASVFSDETELFRSPSEVRDGDIVHIRLRIMKDTGLDVFIISETGKTISQMKRIPSDDDFDWYESSVTCGSETLRYCFYLPLEDCGMYYTRKGCILSGGLPSGLPEHLAEMAFRIIPGFHVPDWAVGALQYQIFPDRFYNSDPSNDVTDGEYSYSRGKAFHATSWDALPPDDDYRCFYGGDLGGIIEKLDYIESLGVEAIYLNPIFVSPSSHGYDAQDYDHVDPHLTFIRIDKPATPVHDHNNREAAQYIQRTTDPENLQASDNFFAWFCQHLHRRGIRIILDGVFNHCGSFHRWIDREGIYASAGIKDGAFHNPASPYRNYFSFDDNGNYEAWYSFDTLPKLNYDTCPEVIEEIMRIGEKWAAPPYCIDGWRLDVGADLGHTDEVNHRIWKEFRQRVRRVNPEILIIAEHYGNPSAWLQGDEWDTVMNYDAFMDPLSFFLTGMEKHSDEYRPDVHQNGVAFFNMMKDSMALMPTASIQCAMTQLSNHDHSRFLTRTNGQVGRAKTKGNTAAGKGIDPAVFREAVVVQMTWPGAPTIYYGDEAGMTGWTDPDNRRTYPWGREHQEFIALHQALAALRQEHPMLRRGSLKPLCCGHGFIAYARFDAEDLLVIACNNNDSSMRLSIPVTQLGIHDDHEMFQIFRTDEIGFKDRIESMGHVRNGCLEIAAQPRSSYVIRG